MKRSALLHPFLITTVSILFAYVRVIIDIPPWQIIRPLLFLYLFLVLLIYPAYKIMGEWTSAGMLLSIIALGLFISEEAFYFVGASHLIVIIIWAVYAYLRKRKNDIEQIVLLINFTGAMLVIILIIKIVPLFTSIPLSYIQNSFLPTNSTSKIDVKKIENSPDIYYIILDGYARADVVEKFYYYDNSDFILSLQERGFILPEENHSNYSRTVFSVSSTLNMNYIDKIVSKIDALNFSWVELSPLIRHSQVQSTLNKLGYETFSIQSAYSVANNNNVDRYFQLRPVKLSAFEDIFIRNTAFSLLEPILKKVVNFLSFENHHNLVLFGFDTLSEVPDYSGSQFIYAHIITPHPPFVFDENGHMPQFDSSFAMLDGNDYLGSREEYRVGYVKQMSYTNKEMIKVIDQILQKSDIPPIIIIQADHGSGMLTDFQNIENTCLQERFSPFAAYYLPGVNEEEIPSDITPVNLFRIIFNEYFDAELPLLENRYFYYNAYYEISLEQIEAPCEIQP